MHAIYLVWTPHSTVVGRYRTAVLDEGIVGLLSQHQRVSRQVQAEQVVTGSTAATLL